MTDSSLTAKEAAELVRRLATDDAFRALFESKPAKALADMGISADTITNLKAACLCPGKLADKSVFQKALDQMDAEVLTAAGKFSPPKASVSR